MKVVATCLLLSCALPALASQPIATPGQPTAATAATSPADAAFAAWDADRDGTLSRKEFRAGWTRLLREGARQSRLRRQFEAVDADHDGAVGAGEYPSLLLVRQAGKAAPPLSAFDADRNGRLEFAEYTVLVRRLMPAGAQGKAGK